MELSESWDTEERRKALLHAILSPEELIAAENRWETDATYRSLLRAIIEDLPGEEWYANSPKILHQWEKLETCDCRGLRLEGKAFGKICFSGYDLSHSSFKGSTFHKTYLQGAILSDADFSGSVFDRAHMIPLYGTHVNFSGSRFVVISANESDISLSNFQRCTFERMHFTGSQLRDNDFRWLNSVNSDFSSCELQRARFDFSEHIGSEFTGARLNGSSFVSAALKESDMRGVDFRGADLSSARLMGGRFGNTICKGRHVQSVFDDTPENRRVVAASGADGVNNIVWSPVENVTHLRGRAVAGDRCPRSGFWFTPAKVGSRRYFSEGDAMPMVESDFGSVIWQWDQNQSPPTL
jgi:uncharacterized protein YjbI with pentapeptide repeats